MKKQKSPVILVVILSSLVVGGFFVSQRAREETMSPEDRMKLEMERQAKNATSEARETGSAAEMAKAAASSVDGVSADRPEDQLINMRRSMGGPMASRPSIEKMVRSSSKPTPNESAVSSQWYDQNSYKQKEAGK